MDLIHVDRARNSVLHVYEMIEALFTLSPSHAQTVITELMLAFSDKFSMITPSGVVIGRRQVEQLLNVATGTRPGLEIRIRDMRTIWQDKTSVALRYKELQRAHGLESACLSVVIIDVTQSKTRWKFLHETKLGMRAR